MKGLLLEPHDTTKLTIEACSQFLSDKVFCMSSVQKDASKNTPGKVGLEIEMLPLGGRGFERAGFLDPSGAQNIGAALSLAAPQKKWQPIFDSAGMSIVSSIKLEEKDNITFEPGGQIEHSSPAYDCLAGVVKRVNEVQADLDVSLAENAQIKLRGIGTNPYMGAEEIKLQVHKQRYKAMDQYFSLIGPWGRLMMRETCSIQVCLDYGIDERTLAKRFFAAQLTAPFARAIFAYSPYLGGKLSDFDCIRSRAWNNIDPSRTGVQNQTLTEFANDPLDFDLSKQKCVEAYLSFLMKSNVAFVPGAGYRIPSSSTTFSEWIESDIFSVSPRHADLVHQLTMLFPEVRPKGFFEIRSVDSQDRVWQFVPACFYSGILYDDDALDKSLDLLLPCASNIDWWFECSEYGLQHQKMANIASELMLIALEGYNRLPLCYREGGIERSMGAFAENFTLTGKTPASELRRFLVESRKDRLDDYLWQSLSEKWSELSLGLN